MAEPIILTNCGNYEEDPHICDDVGETKGQCANCGAKWYEHNLGLLFGSDLEYARQIQALRGTK